MDEALVLSSIIDLVELFAWKKILGGGAFVSVMWIKSFHNTTQNIGNEMCRLFISVQSGLWSVCHCVIERLFKAFLTRIMTLYTGFNSLWEGTDGKYQGFHISPSHVCFDYWVSGKKDMVLSCVSSHPSSLCCTPGRVNLVIEAALHLVLRTSLLFWQQYIVSPSSEKWTYCKSLWFVSVS